MCQSREFQGRSLRDKTLPTMTSLVGIFFFMCALVNTVSCRSFIKNDFNNEEHGHYYKEQSNGDDTGFDWQLSTDNVDFHKILRRLDLDEIITFLKNASNDVGDASAVKRRQKRSQPLQIFGKDERKKITTSLDAEVMPYAASVKTSTKCSGIVIGPKYVLTAAHCAYKGKKRISKIKVGFLQTSGRVRWRKVRKVHVPRQWLTLWRSPNKALRGKYDYAVLELRRNHRRRYMKPIAFYKSHGSKLQFNGFPGDKNPNTMWHTHCNVDRYLHGFPINYCDLSRGMSGSGSYLWLNKKDYVVRGIVIASVTIRTKHGTYRFNVLNPLTPEKIKQICKWMKAGRDCKSS